MERTARKKTGSKNKKAHKPDIGIPFTGYVGLPFPNDPNAGDETDDSPKIPEVELFSAGSDEIPQELFPPGRNADMFGVTHERFVHVKNRYDILIYADGSCLRNGQPDPAAGWAFHYRLAGKTRTGYTNGIVSGRLEDKGPDGQPAAQTSNRAELRAVIAILEFRAWYGEGNQSLIIATDSEYVCVGATQWVRSWARREWMTRQNKPVANRDLWEHLLEKLREYESEGMTVEFWRIPRELNTIADNAAKAAALGPRSAEYAQVLGVLV